MSTSRQPLWIANLIFPVAARYGVLYYFTCMKMGLLLFALFCGTSLCAQRFLYKGRIGDQPVVMQLDTGGGSAHAQYFFWNRKKLVSLDGGRSSNGLLKLTDFRQTQTLELTLRGRSYTGTWTKGGRKMKIGLKPASLSEYANRYDVFKSVRDWKNEWPIDYVVSSGYVFQKIRTDTLNGYVVERLREKYTGVLTVRIAGAQTPATVRINNKLLEEAIIRAMGASECLGASDGAHNMVIDKLYINSDVLSVGFYATAYCGGDHPGEISDAYNFDRRTGRLLHLNDVLWLGGKAPPAEGSTEYYGYRDSVLAPWLLEIFSRLYPSQISGRECPYDSESAWQDFKWCFTKEGLYIGPQFVHAASACNNPGWPVIPYFIVRRYKNPKSRLAF